mmetsp:Transcript_15036/g.21538  ORF Transcript_15036/g.21538 Transcript_15036/m.21538 type:complete len:80 (-) Transcript_15036:920-1159(-)
MFCNVRNGNGRTTDLEWRNSAYLGGPTDDDGNNDDEDEDENKPTTLTLTLLTTKQREIQFAMALQFTKHMEESGRILAL